MNPRQEQLLNLVIENYIKIGEPIGSRFLIEKEKLGWSEATVRNDLRLLEEEGYLFHPHTSAGRIPTLVGYRYYVGSLDLDNLIIDTKDEKKINEILVGEEKDFENGVKILVRGLADISKEVIIYTFGCDKVYYTGLSNLFSKKEFAESNLVVDVSAVFDRCEEFVKDFSNTVTSKPRFFLGDDHPFGNYLSILATRVRKEKEDMLLMVGLIRMDYKRNFTLIKRISSIFENL